MAGNENQIELFEFTQEEKTSIEETAMELAEIMCTMVANGVQIEKAQNTPTIMEIVGYIIGEDRKKSFNFAMVSSKEIDGKVVIDGGIAKNSQLFLQNLLTKQLKTLEANIPKALAWAQTHGNLIEGGTNVHSLPVMQEKAIEN